VIPPMFRLASTVTVRCVVELRVKPKVATSVLLVVLVEPGTIDESQGGHRPVARLPFASTFQEPFAAFKAEGAASRASAVAEARSGREEG